MELYSRIQSVPSSKHAPSRLQKNLSFKVVEANDRCLF